MPNNFLAIGWDASECRVAVAALRGRQFQVEHAFAFVRSQSDDSPETLGAQLAKELDARGCGRPETLVSVGRTRIELRQFAVPPAEENDLPDLVRFQAAREFNELDDQWRLDFLPIDTEGEGSKTVLATAISPAEIASIEKVCQAAGLTLRRVLLRPCEAASLLVAPGDKKSPKLLIELFAEEADLTVVSGGKTVFLRTTRFAGGRPAVQAMVAEIRLTLAAARNQLGGEKVDSLVLYGKDDDVSLAESVKAELGIPVTLLDPFAGISTSAALAGAMPPQSDRFAPLLGMLQIEARGARHPIDFLNPRRRAEPKSKKKYWVAAGAAAVVLFLGYVIYGRVSHMWLADEVNNMTAEIARLKTTLEDPKHTHDREEAADMRKWTDLDRNCLDKLDGLAKGMPRAEYARLVELSFSSNPHGSDFDLKGLASKHEYITDMENGVRPLVGNMRTTVSKETTSRPYPWEFEAKIEVDKVSGNASAKPSTSAKPATSAASSANTATSAANSAKAASSAASGQPASSGTATAPSRGSPSSSGAATSSGAGAPSGSSPTAKPSDANTSTMGATS